MLGLAIFGGGRLLAATPGCTLPGTVNNTSTWTCTTAASSDQLVQTTHTWIFQPVLGIASIMVPIFIVLNAAYKLNEHRESPISFIIETIFKAGAAFAVLAWISTFGG